MRADLRQLHRRAFDVTVIGAGVQGAAIARELATRGMSVLLLERRDVAAGTSSRSSCLVHGGLRYLRNGQFALVREALAERERLLRLAPHLVRPLPMLMPLFPETGVPAWQLRIGTWLYGRLARNSTLPRPRRLSAAAAARAFPGLRTRGLRSAIEMFDARTHDVRLTLANVLAATAAGAAFVNHAEVRGVGADGVEVVDHVLAETFRIRTGHVVNAAGPAVDRVRRSCGIAGEELVRTSRGTHLVLPARSGELALAAFLPDQRIQFVIPHPSGTLCGTTEVDDAFGEAESGAPHADLDYLHDALGQLLDPVPGRRDVQNAHTGWRALPRAKGPSGALQREAFAVTERAACGPVHSVVGGKLTTHRSFAERLAGRLFGFTDASPTRTAPLPGGHGPREVDDELWWRYGSRVARIRERIAEQPRRGEVLCAHRPFLAAELALGLDEEGAVSFADVMIRRLAHLAGPCLQPDCLRRAHDWFLRERRHDVDSDADAAIERLVREHRNDRGDLEPWQEQRA